MSLNSWFPSRQRQVGRGQHAGTGRRRLFFQPRLEILEDRTLLSTFHVLNLDNDGDDSLRAAIEAANLNPGADRIVFAPNVTGTIALASPLGVTDDLKILGPGADRLTVSGEGTTRVFEISGSTTEVRIDALTIANGMATGTVGSPTGPVTLGGGILNTGADLTLSSVILVDNRASAASGVSAAGGGVANVFHATLTVKGSRFEGNKALTGTGQTYGGAIFNDAGSILTVQDCTFTGNQATGGLTHVGSRGGAIANAGHSQASVMDSDFRNNLAQGGNGGQAGVGGGGAILNLTYGVLDGSSVGATLTVRGSSFIANQAIGGMGGPVGQAQGGAINTIGEGALTVVTSSEFSGNVAKGGIGCSAIGGAMNALSAALTISDSSFTGNQAIAGGAPPVPGLGGANAFGGALSIGVLSSTLHVYAALTVTDSTFTANQARGGSGGNGTPGGMAIGGAIEADHGTMDLRDSLLSGNQAIGGRGGDGGGGGAAVGGAISCGSPSDLPSTQFSVKDSMLVGNLAQGGAGGAGGNGGMATGGGIANTVTTLVVSGTTLMGNQAVGGAGGAGGSGGVGLGGGLYNGSAAGKIGTAILTETTITGNQAEGGAAGSGGSPGVGVGGGVYNGGSISIDDVDLNFGNEADLFPDCFGC